MKNILFLFILIILVSCNRDKIESVFNKTYYINGNLDQNNIETGKWEFIDKETRKVSQSGFYKNGVRSGKWFHKELKDSLLWREIFLFDTLMRTNLPDFLKKSFSEEKFDSYDMIDTSKLLRAKFGFENNVLFDVNDYKKIIYEEVRNKGSLLLDTLNLTYSTTCGTKINYYYLKTQNKKNKIVYFYVLNGFVDELLYEISIQSDEENHFPGKILVDTISKHLFIGNERIIDDYYDCQLLLNINRSSKTTITIDKDI
jgi:hypothetical protein